MNDYIGSGRQVMLERVTSFVALPFSLLEGLIGIRIFFKFIDANPRNAIASWVYDISSLFLLPFHDLIANPAVSGMVLEITSLIAMIAYALLAWVILRTLQLVFYRPGARSVIMSERER